MVLHTDSHINSSVNPNLEYEAYDLNSILDFMKIELGVETDKKLSFVLQVYISMISKIRNKRRLISPDMVTSIHDLTGMSIKKIKRKIGL